ncbi:hypothetical protein [Cylindrospermopsis raciborskii]|uniref:hypothetical protein n=1 Tax=Cylindrospermopsis raciborskii TaxID=77022 RepID=UPI00128F6623|nr:hypothetical protein [Cylindrospermopsis raciborskii]
MNGGDHTFIFSRENLKGVKGRSQLVYEFEEGDQCRGRGSKLLAGKKPPPGQLKLFWDEVDVINKEIIRCCYEVC